MVGTRTAIGIVLAAGVSLLVGGCTDYSAGGNELLDEPEVQQPAPVDEPAPVEVPEPEPMWVCTYSPTYDEDWHNDVLCSNGVGSERPYLREWDTYITETEIMESAQEYEDGLNATQ